MAVCEKRSMTNEKNTLWVNFGAWYKSERRARNISQADAARSADITRTHLSDIENGNTGVKRDTVVRLADAIGTERNETLGRAGFGVPPMRNDHHTGERRKMTEDELRQELEAVQETVARLLNNLT